MAASNPALGTRLDPEFVTSEFDTLEPADFERERLGRWDEKAGAQWIFEEDWGSCAADVVPSGENVVLALASRDDSAGLVSATISDQPHVAVETYWGAELDVLAIEQAIRDACQRYSVLRVAMDRARWSRSLLVLEGLPVIEYP
jgi:hypothetical protein